MSQNKNSCLYKTDGFTVLELMLAVIILAILVSLALPTYQHQSKKSHHLDGQNKLVEIMHLQQTFFSQNLRYSTELEDELKLPVNMGSVESDRGFYKITAEPCEDNINNCVRLIAMPIDEEQAALSLDSLGRRTPDTIW